MFDTKEVPDRSTVAVDAITLAARGENAAGARRLAAIGDLYALRAPDDDVEKLNWALDGFCGLVAEIAAALSVSWRRAAAQLQRAITLRERLPKVAAIYAKGLIDYVMVAMIVSRTDLIDDDDAARRVDAELAAKILKWGPLSKPKLEQRIDAIIARSDPAGVHGPRPPADRRDVSIDPMPGGMAAVYATLEATAAAALDAALDAAAGTVCRADPRSQAQRRADALVALASTGTLACGCGESDCPAVSVGSAPVGPQAVIHVIAEPATLDGDAPGFLPGFGQIPGAQVRALAERACVRTVHTPAPVVEPRYRPSTALAEFVRCRDLTCRFPGCDQPAERCDLDHTIPYPAGPTHPSNIKALCRFHHLLKTFHTGWSDHQYPDGTIVWTSPTGHTYITKPEGAYWFPALGTPTGSPEALDCPPPSPRRGQCMPTRRQTRAQERRDRIRTERAVNEQRLQTEAAALFAGDDPAPF